MIPFALADLRLADRYSAGPTRHSALVTPLQMMKVAVRALGAVAGGREPVFLLFVALALLGLVILAKRRAPFALLACLAIAVPPVLLVLGRSGGGDSGHLSARQLILWLPIWAALIGVGTARALHDLRSALQVISLAALTVLAVLASSASPDPRTAVSGTSEAMAPPRPGS